MATRKSTSAAQAPSIPQEGDTAPVNYLGLPCQIAKAFGRYAGTVEDARREPDPKALIQQIGLNLIELNDSTNHLHEAIQLALESLPDYDEEVHGVRALLAMAVPYARDLCNTSYYLGGKTLVALELAALVEAPSHA